LAKFLLYSDTVKNLEGCLVFNEERQIDHVFPSTLPAIIKWQYDQLNPEFQRILRAASIVGLRFSLEEVVAALYG
jgi:predicted ATPase